jgi:hypothetical protein
MSMISVTPVTIHPITIPNSENLGIGPRVPSSRLGLILALSISDPQDDFHTITPVFSTPAYSREHLACLNSTRLGQAFFIMRNGKLARRGVVCGETGTHYVVRFSDVWGIVGDARRVRKSDTTKWQWFPDVEEANLAYDRMYNVKQQATRTPQIVWKDRSLEQIYFQESN